MRREVFVRQRDPAHELARDPRAAVAADERAAHARGRTARRIDQRAQRGAALDLVYARVRDWSRERHERRPRLTRRAELAEPSRSVPCDQREVRERLRIAHERRALAHPRFERSWRRERGERGTAAEEVHERGLLPRDIRRWDRHELRRRAALTARGAFLEGRRDAFDARARGLAHAYEQLVRA